MARRSGRSVRLADVARVVETGAPRFGDALIQGGPGVLLTLLGQYGANTLEVTQAVERALADMGPLFEREGVTLYPACTVRRPSSRPRCATFARRCVLGGVLVAVVLFAFLGTRARR